MITKQEYYVIILNSLYVFTFFIVLELIVALKNSKKSFNLTDSLVSLGLGLGNYLATLLTNSIVLIFFIWLYNNRISELNVSPWLYWFLCFLADDLTFFIMHFTSHKVRWFWASHLVHHSSDYFNLTTAIRGPWTGNISGTFVFWAWMPLLGFHPNSIILMQAFSLFYQFLLHTEMINKLPFLVEFVFNSPSNHRVHHGTEEKYLDKNFGGTLIIWDRIFNTFQIENERPTYGLTKKIKSPNPIKIAFYGWKTLLFDIRNAKSFKSKVNFILKPPSWTERNNRNTE